MERIPAKYKKLVLVCTNLRTDGTKCCAGNGSDEIRDVLKARVKEAGLPVRVSKSGCLGMCATGPTVVIMPDDLWFGGVGLEDVGSIVEMLRS
jgi:(2Fe-2S) ferredoxin